MYLALEPKIDLRFDSLNSLGKGMWSHLSSSESIAQLQMNQTQMLSWSEMTGLIYIYIYIKTHTNKKTAQIKKTQASVAGHTQTHRGPQGACLIISAVSKGQAQRSSYVPFELFTCYTFFPPSPNTLLFTGKFTVQQRIYDIHAVIFPRLYCSSQHVTHVIKTVDYCPNVSVT